MTHPFRKPFVGIGRLPFKAKALAKRERTTLACHWCEQPSLYQARCGDYRQWLGACANHRDQLATAMLPDSAYAHKGLPK